MIDRATSTFFRGLTVVLPIAATVWVLHWIFVTMDGALVSDGPDRKLPPGVGILIMIAVAWIVGALAVAHPTRRHVARLEFELGRVPVIRLVYGTVKDFVDAFLGKRKRFDKPVLLRLGAPFDADVLGFVTCESLADIGLPGKCAVYLPQSYNFGGNLLLMPKDRLVPLDLEAGAAMSFVMSGGVSTMAAQSLPSSRSGPTLETTIDAEVTSA